MVTADPVISFGNNCFQGHTSQVKVAGRALTRDQNCTGVSCDQQGVNIRYHFTWIARCLLAQCSIVQDFPLNTNPQFTALPQASFRYSRNFTKFCSKHYFAINNENLSRSCPLPPTLPCSALPAKPPPIVASSGLDNSNCPNLDGKEDPTQNMQLMIRLQHVNNAEGGIWSGLKAEWYKAQRE